MVQGHASDGVIPPTGACGTSTQASRHNITAEAAPTVSAGAGVTQKTEARARYAEAAGLTG